MQEPNERGASAAALPLTRIVRVTHWFRITELYQDSRVCSVLDALKRHRLRLDHARLGLSFAADDASGAARNACGATETPAGENQL